LLAKYLRINDFLVVYNERLLTIKYKQSTKLILFFFDAKKEPKKLLGGESPKTLERFKVVFI